MYKKEYGISLIIIGTLLILLMFIPRKKKNRIDPLEIETPFLASITRARGVIYVIAACTFLILGIILILEE